MTAAPSNKHVLLLAVAESSAPFAGSPREGEMLAGCERLNSLTNEMQFCVSSLGELALRVSSGAVTVQDLRAGCDVAMYDLVRFMYVPYARDHFQAISYHLQHQAVPFLHEQDVLGTPFGKIAQMVRLALHNVSVPDTLALWPTLQLEQLAQNSDWLPGVLKANNGTKGKNNFLVRDWPQLGQLLRECPEPAGYILQPYIPNDGHYRVLYASGERLIYYMRARPGSHISNASQGGQGVLVTEADCDPSLLALSARAMAAYGREMGGVDLIQHKTTGQPYVLEINSTPSSLGGLFLDEKLRLLSTFFEQHLSGGC